MSQQRLFDLPVVRPVSPSETVQALGAALPRAVHLGTSSWSFPGWQGLVYDGRYRPQELAQHGLHAYAQHPLMGGVGVDRAHYAPVPVEELAAWRAMVPKNFRFLVKAHEACTLRVYPAHGRYGRYAGTRNDRFLDAGYARDVVVQPYCEGLGAQGGTLLFQFAAQDPALLGGPDKFAARLAAFLQALPRGREPPPWRSGYGIACEAAVAIATLDSTPTAREGAPLYAVEVRNAALITPRYGQALASAGAVHCFNILPSMPPLQAQAQALRGVRFSALVLRWMRHDGIGYDEAVQRYKPFDRLARPDNTSRDSIVWLVRRALAAGVKAVHVVINNKAEGCAPLSVLRLATALSQPVTRGETLSTNVLPPEQGEVFKP